MAMAPGIVNTEKSPVARKTPGGEENGEDKDRRKKLEDTKRQELQEPTSPPSSQRSWAAKMLLFGVPSVCDLLVCFLYVFFF